MKYEAERTPTGETSEYEAVPASPLPPSAGYRHIHGWCRRCKARRASWTAGCPECHDLLDDLSLHEPHGSVYETIGEIPAGTVIQLEGPDDTFEAAVRRSRR